MRVNIQLEATILWAATDNNPDAPAFTSPTPKIFVEHCSWNYLVFQEYLLTFRVLMLEMLRFVIFYLVLTIIIIIMSSRAGDVSPVISCCDETRSPGHISRPEPVPVLGEELTNQSAGWWAATNERRGRVTWLVPAAGQTQQLSWSQSAVNLWQRYSVRPGTIDTDHCWPVTSGWRLVCGVQMISDHVSRDLHVSDGKQQRIYSEEIFWWTAEVLGDTTATRHRWVNIIIIIIRGISLQMNPSKINENIEMVLVMPSKLWEIVCETAA